MKIGNAKISETGTINGAKGDQTKGEVAIQDYYVHSKGWDILKPKSEEVADKMVYCMIAACNNDNIGYGQNDRLTSYNEAKKVGFDCAKITNKCNTDCSELIRICAAYAGIETKDFYTGNEKLVLLATGKFELVSKPSYGCVLITKTKGHTALVIDGKVEPVVEKAVPTMAIKGKPYDVEAFVGPNFETKVKGSVIPINDIQIRTSPNFDVRNRWFKIQNGYISAYRVEGWVEDDHGFWYEKEEHKYPKSSVVSINGEDYAFDHDGYLITKERLAEDNHIVY